MNHRFKFIDLFAGIGGFHYALSECGGECVMASEIDETARATYEKNFGMKTLGDISDIKSSDIPYFDLLCAGFPCQSFSNIGTKGGLDDPRGALIYQVMRILREKQPKTFLLENVKGLLSHNKGNTFDIIKDGLKNCGYEVFYNILETKDYGLPQIRKRLFIVGIRSDINKIFEFPTPTGCTKLLSDVLMGETDRKYAFTIRIGGRRSGINNKFNWDCYRVDGVPRYIRIEECLELQGFPRDFYLAGNSDKKFKQIGNAVPTIIPKVIVEQLLLQKII